MQNSPLFALQEQLARLGQAGGSPQLRNRYVYSQHPSSQVPIPGLEAPLPVYWRPPVAAPTVESPKAPTIGDAPGTSGANGEGPGSSPSVSPSATSGSGLSASPGAQMGGMMSSPAPSSTGISNSALGMLGVFGIPGLSQAAVAANSIANSVLGNQTTSVQAISDADANAANQAGVTIGGPPGFEGIADNSNSGNAASNAGLSGTAAGISAGAGNGQAGLSGSNPGEQGSEASSGGEGGGSGGGCFLTEAAMRHAKATHSDHDDQSLELELMRGFRDNYMMQDPGLRDLVMQYYDLAPRVVKALDKHPQADEIYAQMREKFLRPGVEHVLHGRPDQALKTYAQLLDFVAPHAGTPEARTLGAGGRMVDSAIDEQYGGYQ